MKIALNVLFIVALLLSTSLLFAADTIHIDETGIYTPAYATRANTFTADQTLQATNPGGDAFSHKIILEASQAAGPVTHTSSLYTAFAGGVSYLVVAAPDAGGVETSVFAIMHNLMGFANDGTVDIGLTGSYRPKDIFLSGNLDAEAGSITAETSITADTGDITATVGNIAAGANLQAGGDLIVNGGEIGLTGDLNLMQLAANVLTVNGTIAARHAAHDFIPIEWCHDGAVAPAPAGEVDSGNGTVMAREFGGAAGNIVQDIVCPWEVPDDIVVATHIVYKISAVITNAVGPAAEGVSFKLSGYSIGDNDSINGAFGAEIEVTQQNYTAAQFDRMQTAYSGTVTVTNLAAGELVMLHFERDTADAQDDYAKPIGITGITVRSERLTEAF